MQEVTFPNGDLTLHGRVGKPDGAGPFPAVLYNHGSEKSPGVYFEDLARVFLQRGYVFFGPFRRGQGTSPGPYIQDQLAAANSGRDRLLVQLHELQLGDQLAGLKLLRELPYVDGNNIAVYGWSYGGIQTILAAEANPGYRVAIDCSGAAQSWEGNPALRTRMVAAVAKIQIPVFLIQAENDYSLAPNKALAAEFEHLGKPYRMKTYPPFGSGAVGEEGHQFCGPKGATGWATDVFRFIGSRGAALA